MFSNRIKDLIYYFNVYNKIPSLLCPSYVEFCLNEGRLRQKNVTPNRTLYVDSKGAVGIGRNSEVGTIEGITFIK